MDDLGSVSLGCVFQLSKKVKYLLYKNVVFNSAQVSLVSDALSPLANSVFKLMTKIRKFSGVWNLRPTGDL